MSRRYSFSYQCIERYNVMVRDYHFLLRCRPHEAPFQHCEQNSLRLLTGVKVNTAYDTFGNAIHYGSFEEEHDLFVISMSGIVMCDEYQIKESNPEPIYLNQSHFTQASGEIAKLSQSVGLFSSDLEVALQLMGVLYSRIEYRAGATTVNTTAAMALELGAGVCQDLSHLLLSMCRFRGIRARYVMGYVIGEGETHAWVEIWSDGIWYGVDPTHNILIDSGYIKVAHGRDAADCSIVRGMRRGVSEAQTQVRVVVEEI
ncbi:MAG: transglutaminase domain-containing protein [Rikenellaceae bacterium]